MCSEWLKLGEKEVACTVDDGERESISSGGIHGLDIFAENGTGGRRQARFCRVY